MRFWKVGIVGFGKIARDQHTPAIRATAQLELAAVASLDGAGLSGVPCFRTLGEMLDSVRDLDAVAICTPPQVRYAIAHEALAAGKHVLLEKPPTATLTELIQLRDYANAQRCTLFTAWHSRYNAAVAHARRALAHSTVSIAVVRWKEDVHRYHPGQSWMWAPGGFGVFDAGMNAVSIISHVTPQSIAVQESELRVPEDCDTPVAASLTLSTPTVHRAFRVEFDWRHRTEPVWEILITTATGQRFHLSQGGECLTVDRTMIVNEAGRGYQRIYNRFSELLRIGESDVDEEPLRLVADAFLIGRRITTDPFLHR